MSISRNWTLDGENERFQAASTVERHYWRSLVACPTLAPEESDGGNKVTTLRSARKAFRNLNGLYTEFQSTGIVLVDVSERPAVCETSLEQAEKITQREFHATRAPRIVAQREQREKREVTVERAHR